MIGFFDVGRVGQRRSSRLFAAAGGTTAQSDCNKEKVGRKRKASSAADSESVATSGSSSGGPVPEPEPKRAPSPTVTGEGGGRGEEAQGDGGSVPKRPSRDGSELRKSDVGTADSDDFLTMKAYTMSAGELYDCPL